MVMKQLGALILAILTIAVLVYVFVWEDTGLLSQAGESAEKLKEFIPDIGLGEEVEAVPATIPEHHADAILYLRNAINYTLQSNKPDCFMDYGRLPELGHRRTSIEFIYEDGTTTMRVYSGTDGRQLIPELTTEFKEMIPCVIAGSDNVADNFFNKFIKKESVTSPDYFKPTDYVRIFYWVGESYSSGVGSCADGNRIMTIPPQDKTTRWRGNIGWTYSQGPNYHCNNLQDGGIFFSPDKKHICFIPTNYHENADQHGIDEDYVSGSEEEGIRVRLGKKELTKC